MADISMCFGGRCPSKDACYRYTAPVNPYRQSYSDFCVELKADDSKCEWFSPNGLTDKEAK